MILLNLIKAIKKTKWFIFCWFVLYLEPLQIPATMATTETVLCQGVNSVQITLSVLRELSTVLSVIQDIRLTLETISVVRKRQRIEFKNLEKQDKN